MESEKTDNISKEFYELCYRQYEFEMKETDQIYQRVSFVLVLLSLLGTIIFKLGRIDILSQISTTIVFLYYFSILIAFLCFAASIVYAILFILPRKGKYKNLATMKVWQKWRYEYNKYFDQSGGQDKKPNDALLHEITDKLAEAQANNAPINEKRRQYFYHCVLMVAIGIVPVATQAIFYLLLKIKGI
jgi:TM2 domain-containing membrane protein YozV